MGLVRWLLLAVIAVTALGLMVIASQQSAHIDNPSPSPTANP